MDTLTNSMSNMNVTNLDDICGQLNQISVDNESIKVHRYNIATEILNEVTHIQSHIQLYAPPEIYGFLVRVYSTFINWYHFLFKGNYDEFFSQERKQITQDIKLNFEQFFKVYTTDYNTSLHSISCIILGLFKLNNIDI